MSLFVSGVASNLTQIYMEAGHQGEDILYRSVHIYLVLVIILVAKHNDTISDRLKGKVIDISLISSTYMFFSNLKENFMETLN